MKPEIDDFAQLLVSQVRDLAIHSCDVQLRTKNLNTPIAKRWNCAKNKGDIENMAEMIIADAVDDTIFYLLHAIDEGILNLSFNSIEGKAINLSTEGLQELAGWYVGEWRTKYSKQRNYNDLSNI